MKKEVPNYYLALGDSITAGYGVGSRNFASLYYTRLVAAQPDLRFVNYGISGLTTGGLANLLSSDLRLRNLVAQSRVITLTIGSNDLLRAARKKRLKTEADLTAILSGMQRNLDLIGHQLRALNPQAVVKVATIYNPIPVKGDEWSQFGQLAQVLIAEANNIIVHWARQYGFNVIPIDRAFQGREWWVIGPDRVHPSLSGHQVMATEYASN